MSFLKPASSPLRLTDHRLRSDPELLIDTGLLGILKTTALVESRADNYAEYLHAVFQSRGQRWREAIEGWNREERQHGAVLRKLVMANDPTFDFDSAMQHYRATVPYHACDGHSIRGSIAGELVARCVVEALASTFYRTLKDSLCTPVSRAVLDALARDEARHYGMFAAMLREEQEGPHALGRLRRCWVGIRRMTELGDQQIIGAYISAAGTATGGKPLALAAQHYAAALYPRYRLRHLRFAARLICPILFGRRDALTVTLFALTLRMGVLMKGLLARGQVSAASCLRGMLGRKVDVAGQQALPAKNSGSGACRRSSLREADYCRETGCPNPTSAPGPIEMDIAVGRQKKRRGFPRLGRSF